QAPTCLAREEDWPLAWVMNLAPSRIRGDVDERRVKKVRVPVWRNLKHLKKLVQTAHRVTDAHIDTGLVGSVARVCVANCVVEVGIHVCCQMAVVDMRRWKRKHETRYASSLTGKRKCRELRHDGVDFRRCFTGLVRANGWFRKLGTRRRCIVGASAYQSAFDRSNRFHVLFNALAIGDAERLLECRPVSQNGIEDTLANARQFCGFFRRSVI